MMAFGAGKNDSSPTRAGSRVDGFASNEGVSEESNTRPTEDGPPQITNPPNPTSSFDLATQPFDQEAGLFGDPVDTDISGFHEDLLMTQAMFDVEQGLDSPACQLVARTMLTPTKLWDFQGTEASQSLAA